MFKFARHFFIIFILTTIVPLVVMLLWNHHRMGLVMQEKKGDILEIVGKELKQRTAQYLEIRESVVLEKILDLMLKKMPADEVCNVYGDSQVKLIYNKNISKVTSYYEAVKTSEPGKLELYSAVEIPYPQSGGIKGIKFSEKVDIKQLHPAGPFNVEVHMGNKINKDSLVGLIKDSYAPNLPDKKGEQFLKLKNAPKFIDKPGKEIKIYGKDGKVLAIMLIKMPLFMPEFSPPPPMGFSEKIKSEFLHNRPGHQPPPPPPTTF